MAEELRDYQQSMLHDLQKAWQTCRSVMVQMPTGTGKTHLMAAVIKREELRVKSEKFATALQACSPAALRACSLIVAHRIELIEQISQTLDAFGIEHGLIVSGKPIDATKRVQVASIQTLAKRGLTPTPSQEEGDGSAAANASLFTLHFSLIIIDEAHHALARTYKMLWEWWPEARFLGLTATPCLLSGEPFTDLFDTLLQSWTIRDFIRKGWLSDLDYVSVRSNSVTMRRVASLDKRGSDGDYQTKQMAMVLDVPESIAHLYDSYRKYAEGKKGIVYAINRQHAQHIAAYYAEQGVRCWVIDSKTPAAERRRIVEEYKAVAAASEGTATEAAKGAVLVNVDIFSEGFDVPEVEFIQLARPTLSLSKYMQQLGRGMRIASGKREVTILDQVGLYLIFGLPMNNRDWQALFRGKIKGRGKTPAQNQRAGDWGAAGEKELVNEEMFRIKEYVVRGDSQSDKPKEQPGATAEHGAIEVFGDNGFYGIKVGPKVTCLAAFERVERLEWSGSRYFAFATLAGSKAGGEPARTVITTDGDDLHACLRGEFLEERDDVFFFREKEGGRFVNQLWDARYNRYYRDAQMVVLGGVTFFVNAAGCYTLRAARDVTCRFDVPDVLYNGHITIIGRELFVKGPELLHYAIAGFQDEGVIVSDGTGWLRIGKDGRVTAHYAQAPDALAPIPLLRPLGLQRERLRPLGESIKPRDYQAEQLDRLSTAFKRCRRVVLQTPLGSGKTFVALKVIREDARRGTTLPDGGVTSCLIVAHRPEVTAQISQALKSRGLTHKVLQGTDIQYYDHDNVVVISTENALAFADKMPYYYLPSTIILDEVHVMETNILMKLRSRFPKARMLGLTATPHHEHGTALGRVFGQMVTSWSIRTLIDRGWLRDVNVVDASRTGADDPFVTTQEDIDDAGRLYETYRREADGMKGVVFAMTPDHARRIAGYYERQGVRSAVIGFDMSEEQRDKVLNDYETGALKVLVCTDYFSEGMRCPDVDFVQLACPTDSLNVYLHQVGCGMHPEKDAEYGSDGVSMKHRRLTVLDHVGLARKFGLPTEEHDWMYLFAGGEKRIVRKQGPGKETAAEAKPVRTGLTKWQQRMERLLGSAP